MLKKGFPPFLSILTANRGFRLHTKYCYTTKFNFSFQKGFDGYCDYFLADYF